ncbi:hypothetical protein WME79_06880 [Sorangium sp. So ce726]|uniref:hypothetical protein n=1 Tax=Sorangium sp. So ce726 TaxID=3133319 RepID=UPI003F5FDE11
MTDRTKGTAARELQRVPRAIRAGEAADRGLGGEQRLVGGKPVQAQQIFQLIASGTTRLAADDATAGEGLDSEGGNLHGEPSALHLHPHVRCIARVHAVHALLINC